MFMCKTCRMLSSTVHSSGVDAMSMLVDDVYLWVSSRQKWGDRRVWMGVGLIRSVVQGLARSVHQSGPCDGIVLKLAAARRGGGPFIL
jgi:hypothetical protein